MNNEDDSLLDTYDVATDYYEVCADKKLKGASNSELKSYLKSERMSDEMANELVRQVDSDFLDGLIRSKSKIPSLWLLAFIVGWLLLLGALTILILMFMSGIISGFVIFVSSALAGAGGGMIAYGTKKRI